ncbi:MAG: DUF1800 domain-containing protein [SAR86 cluster bacterium]|jgi:uncharacterized protein (DUF1800 family)|uniref:DUF1800 domain-containing protein n=1 Tax=SAR86 cluster bacterium TaxID=2030880 RepID=A0A972VWV6_9GAMM|nr:DUF1800 domain-containing protein [SAR86 cluster bacterium]|tara:strand:- start:26674 stop:28332 length:1659 start_codon:yes stop_codon:yes gene_type:complete
MKRFIIASLTIALLSACGGGSSSGSAPTVVPSPAPPSTPAPDPNPERITTAAGVRFLRQATFGPTQANLTRLQQLGYSAWIDEQLRRSPSLQLTYMDTLPTPDDIYVAQSNRMEAWLQNAITANDQLRQRVAFALSEIMVVSESSMLINFANGMAHYYDLLSRSAFGNYRDLLEGVTLHPTMGIYLSVLGNEKPNAALNIRPDENYARESMQLFSIGLVELSLDGSQRLDAFGLPIPTYNQQVIEGFAHVYTGWTFAESIDFHTPSYRFRQPMQAFPAFHDTDVKTLFPDVVLPANQSAKEDLDGALDAIFEHPNVGPFISLRLIQRLVSANPSSAYIERVATVFNSDSMGVRGNLGAVVKAILLDPEARSDIPTATSGKLVEPILRLTGLWRAYGARSQDQRYVFPRPEKHFAQAPLRSPSVFNFFSPDYSPSGEIGDLGLVSPELQIANETTVVTTNNFLATAIFLWNSEIQDLAPSTIYIDIQSDLAFASDAEDLVDRVAERLLGGVISSAARDQAITMVNAIAENESAFRVSEAIHAIATSLDYAILQ